MSEERLDRLWWHKRDVDSLPSRRVFGPLRASYDAHPTTEIAALGEFALRIRECRVELEYSVFSRDTSPSPQRLVDFVLHHVPFRRTVTFVILDILEKLAVEHVPGADLYPPCPMPVEELRQLNRPGLSREFPGPIFKYLWLRNQRKVMDGWSPGAIRAELHLPENQRLCFMGGQCIDYETVDDFYREDLRLHMTFQQPEEYYAVLRSYPPGADRDGGSDFDDMVRTDLIYLASFVRHLDWMLPKILDQR